MYFVYDFLSSYPLQILIVVLDFETNSENISTGMYFLLKKRLQQKYMHAKASSWIEFHFAKNNFLSALKKFTKVLKVFMLALP